VVDPLLFAALGGYRKFRLTSASKASIWARSRPPIQWRCASIHRHGSGRSRMGLCPRWRFDCGRRAGCGVDSACASPCEADETPGGCGPRSADSCRDSSWRLDMRRSVAM